MAIMEEEDDEETLQLQLQEIQARLALKKLQKSKGGASKQIGTDAFSATALRRTTDAGSKPSVARYESRQELHVPVSPAKRVNAEPEPQRSPMRVLLGIDKGLKASDVSLKRAPSLKRVGDHRDEMSKKLGGYLKNTEPTITAASKLSAARTESMPIKTFSERMAEMRDQQAAHTQQEKRVQQARSNTFGIDSKMMQELKQEAEAVPEVKYEYKAPVYTREQILNAANNMKNSGIPQSQSLTSIASGSTDVSKASSTGLAMTRGLRAGRRVKTHEVEQGQEAIEADRAASTFESYSSLHLSKRITPHTLLARTFAGKEILGIPDLFRVVKGPDFSLPAIESDIVLMGIIASKSEAKAHVNNKASKYMVITLTDLKWDISLYLFNSGFEKYWKLTVGTVIAILNTSIMPPTQAATNKFSLTVNSSEDTILEIGKARDLGFCKSIKKDGKTCDNWVDARHTEYCEFHAAMALEKTRAARMEVNTGSSFGRGAKKRRFEPPRSDPWRYKNSRLISSTQVDAAGKKREADRGALYIRQDGVGKVQVVQNSRSAANLLDDEYLTGDAFHYGTKATRMRQRLAQKEKERELAKLLARDGGGLGADYMRTQNNELQPLDPNYVPPSGLPPEIDVKELGLLDRRAEDIRLSPVKRKRTADSPTSSLSAATRGMGGTSAARGWGGALSKDLGRMKDGESLTVKAPVQKKTRIMTEKGIRTPGRESLGLKGSLLDDDDGELVIV